MKLKHTIVYEVRSPYSMRPRKIFVLLCGSEKDTVFGMGTSSLPSGWPQTWKTQGIWKIVKISGKTQGNFNFCRKALENSGKMKNIWHDHQQKCIPSNFPLLSCSGKNLKISWRSQEKLREFSFSKMGPPCPWIIQYNNIQTFYSVYVQGLSQIKYQQISLDLKFHTLGLSPLLLVPWKLLPKLFCSFSCSLIG